MTIGIDGRAMPIRPGLADAIEESWRRLAMAGTWWRGDERLALAAQARAASSCELCRRRKAALSPYADGQMHPGTADLPSAAVEAVHRLATDASRITATWVRSIDEAIGEEKYVEIISVVATITALDTFERSLGRPLRPLPAAVDGVPSRRRPAGATRELAWVATQAPETIAAGEIDPFAVHGDKNIHRALSLVPAEVFNFFDLDVELYLRDHEIRDFTREPRAITHRQIELIAGRVSAINRCYY